RSPGDPAQAHASCLRLRTSLRGLCPEGQTQVRLFRAAGPGWRGHRRGDRSQDRPAEQKAPATEMELGGERRQAWRACGIEAADRGGAGAVRAVSARGMTEQDNARRMPAYAV